MAPSESWERKQEQKRADEAAVRAQYPFLLSKEDAPGVSSHARAARNARILLKRQFPDTRFFVATETYAGGSSLKVSWYDLDGARGSDSPFAKEVDRLVRQFAHGQPDGYDGYDYKDGMEGAFCDVFGSTSYARSQVRFLSAAAKAEMAEKALARALPKAKARRPGPGRL